MLNVECRTVSVLVLARSASNMHPSTVGAPGDHGEIHLCISLMIDVIQCLVVDRLVLVGRRRRAAAGNRPSASPQMLGHGAEAVCGHL